MTILAIIIFGMVIFCVYFKFFYGLSVLVGVPWLMYSTIYKFWCYIENNVDVGMAAVTGDSAVRYISGVVVSNGLEFLIETLIGHSLLMLFGIPLLIIYALGVLAWRTDEYRGSTKEYFVKTMFAISFILSSYFMIGSIAAVIAIIVAIIGFSMIDDI